MSFPKWSEWKTGLLFPMPIAGPDLSDATIWSMG
jgi:hypothetical protein